MWILKRYASHVNSNFANEWKFFAVELSGVSNTGRKMTAINVSNFTARDRHTHKESYCVMRVRDLFVPSCAQLVIQFRVVESKRLIFRWCTTSSTRSVCKSVKRDLKFFGFHDARESFIKLFLGMKTTVIIFLEKNSQFQSYLKYLSV